MIAHVHAVPMDWTENGMGFELEGIEVIVNECGSNGPPKPGDKWKCWTNQTRTLPMEPSFSECWVGWGVEGRKSVIDEFLWAARFVKPRRHQDWLERYWCYLKVLRACQHRFDRQTPRNPEGLAFGCDLARGEDETPHLAGLATPLLLELFDQSGVGKRGGKGSLPSTK
jgi:hypothetical protein